jgi:hypothetical protein
MSALELLVTILGVLACMGGSFLIGYHMGIDADRKGWYRISGKKAADAEMLAKYESECG